MKRWMYAYLAVDVYTYDLLHIAIYAHNDKDNALAFFVGLTSQRLSAPSDRDRLTARLWRQYRPDLSPGYPSRVHFPRLAGCRPHLPQIVWQ